VGRNENRIQPASVEQRSRRTEKAGRGAVAVR
jgi:hypothetical protein